MHRKQSGKVTHIAALCQCHREVVSAGDLCEVAVVDVDLTGTFLVHVRTDT